MLTSFALKPILTAALVVAATLGMAGAASAAPATNVGRHGAAPVAGSDTRLVHWEWRHHHRVWVPDRRRRFYR